MLNRHIIKLNKNPLDGIGPVCIYVEMDAKTLKCSGEKYAFGRYAIFISQQRYTHTHTHTHVLCLCTGNNVNEY